MHSLLEAPVFPTPAWRAAMSNKHCQTWRTWWRVDGDGAAEPAAERSPRCKACNSSTQTIGVHSSHLTTPRNAAASSTTVTTPRPKHLNRSGGKPSIHVAEAHLPQGASLRSPVSCAVPAQPANMGRMYASAVHRFKHTISSTPIGTGGGTDEICDDERAAGSPCSAATSPAARCRGQRPAACHPPPPAAASPPCHRLHPGQGRSIAGIQPGSHMPVQQFF